MTEDERVKILAAVLLIEECAEAALELGRIQHALTKVLRHGERPIYLGVQYDNVADAKRSIGDLAREMRDVQKRIAEFTEAFA